jgi:asparagine synthase (glutamine-hydrolysing)
MCGIAGSINWADSDTLARMNSVQAHRGPDDEGVWEERLPDGGTVGLASRRLAILDLTAAGHQPMSTLDGRLTIVYNGEVYNYPELREELEAFGYTFRSHSDTEAVLYLYLEYGPECVRRLNGMFALAIWDAEKQRLFLARDHFGIKPLYYCARGNRFGFASEAKALLELPGFDRKINLEALHQYLTFLWVPEPLTLFDGVLKLPAGHYGIWREESFELHQYWDLEFPPATHEFGQDERSLVEEFRTRFDASVKSQLLSDVPVGSFLSAGLDSSSIVAGMVEAGASPVRTYTISFPQRYRVGEVTLDDPRVAARTARHFGCDHHEIVVEPDVVSLLPDLIRHMDEPVADPAIIAAYLVAKEARTTVKVLLSGVGGDELLAGYRKHAAYEWVDRYQRIPKSLRGGVIEPALAALPSMRGTPLKGYVRLAKKWARGGSLEAREFFLTSSTYLNDAQKRKLYSDDLGGSIDGTQPWSRHLEYFERVGEAAFLNQMLYLDTKAFMAGLNLNYADKMSMASSVEVRVPFLDRELAEWVASNVPPELKLNRGSTKYLLRQAMRDRLPAEVFEQKKAGFGAPVDYWLANDLREMVDDLLGEANVSNRGLFRPGEVRHYVEEHRNGKEDWSLQIWQFLTLELWAREFRVN